MFSRGCNTSDFQHPSVAMAECSDLVMEQDGQSDQERFEEPMEQDVQSEEERFEEPMEEERSSSNTSNGNNSYDPSFMGLPPEMRMTI